MVNYYAKTGCIRGLAPVPSDSEVYALCQAIVAAAAVGAVLPVTLQSENLGGKTIGKSDGVRGAQHGRVTAFTMPGSAQATSHSS
eukprot:2076551-Rhodomonas_salina.1